MTEQPTPKPYRFTDEDDFCLSARLLPDFDSGGVSDMLSITVEGSDEPQSLHIRAAGVPALAAGILAAAGQQPAAPAAPVARGMLLVKGSCPACGASSLFLGDSGYVTCSIRECPEPDAASTVLERQRAAAPAVPAEDADPPFPFSVTAEKARRARWEGALDACRNLIPATVATVTMGVADTEQADLRRRIAELEQQLATRPLSPYYSHEECGFHWHGRDGMDIPMRDGQPVCPRCELAKAEAAPAVPAGRTELRDRIKNAIDDVTGGFCPGDIIDAVLAVLPAGATADVRKLVKRLVAHAKGFQDVLDESDRAPWARLVRADIDELDATLAVLPADTGQAAEIEQLRAERDTLKHVAAGNLRHVKTLVPELERAEAEIKRLRADRSTWLREAADELDSIGDQFDIDACTCGDCALCAWKDAAKHLRRMADEAQPAEDGRRIPIPGIPECGDDCPCRRGHDKESRP